MAKERNGFVTNSSSSSFVIAFKEMNDIDQETQKKYPFLKHIWNLLYKSFFNNDPYNNKYVSRTKEEYDKNILEIYWNDTLEELMESEYAAKEYKESVSYLNKGYSILNISVDYSDDVTRYIIKSLLDGENYILISHEG